MLSGIFTASTTLHNMGMHKIILGILIPYHMSNVPTLWSYIKRFVTFLQFAFSKQHRLAGPSETNIFIF